MTATEHEAIEAITSAPIFAGLPAVEIAKLVGSVELGSTERGEYLVPIGGHPDGLLIIRSGDAEIVCQHPDGALVPMGSLVAGDTYGEVALGGASDGEVGLRARTHVVSLLLPQSRYRQLASAYPEFGKKLALRLGERLQERNRSVTALTTTLHALITSRLDSLTADQRVLLRRASLADGLAPDLIDALGGSALRVALIALSADLPLISQIGDTLVFSEPLRDVLRAELVSVSAVDELSATHLMLARAYEASDQLAQSMRHYAAAESWTDVVRVGRGANGSLDAETRQQLGQWLRTLPAPDRERAPGLAALANELDASSGSRRASAAPKMGLSRRQQIGLVASAALFAAIAIPTAPEGLSREGQLAVALLAASVPLMVFEVIADHLVALFLVAGWAAMGLVPARVALSGYASTTWFVVLAILGIGVGIGKTGLLYRAVLFLANRAPKSLSAQALMLAVGGLLFTPAMPYATSRMALSAPVGLEMIDAFGLERRGPSSVIVGIATLLGFGVMGTLFLTGTSSGLLVHSVLPESVQAQFSFLPWFIAALPLHAVIFAITFAATVWMFRKGATVPVRNELLRAQSVALGKPSLSEWLSAVVMVVLIAGLVTEPWHKINAAWIACAGLLVLGGLGIVDANSFRNGINWSFLIFFGAITSIGDVLTALKVDTWMGTAMSSMLAPLAGVPLLFLIGFTIAGMAICFAVRWQAASVLLTIVMSPPAAAIGISPWVIGIIALTATNLWVFPYQSTIYLALYGGVEGRLFTHEQIRPIAIVYGFAVLVGVIVSVPIWRAMGLVP